MTDVFQNNSQGTGPSPAPQELELVEQKRDLEPLSSQPSARNLNQTLRSHQGTHLQKVAVSGGGASGQSSHRRSLISWRQINYTVDLKVKNGQNANGEAIDPEVGVGKKRILRNLTGYVKPGELLAVMGASGAGKSTFLEVIMGRFLKGVQGDVCMNAVPVADVDMKHSAAIVLQDDLLMPTLTPEETLEFAALLRLPNTMSRSEKLTRKDQLIEELQLTGCRNTLNGFQGVTGGISGGERKRVSIAVELLTDPSFLAVDEPTSGLDSDTAEQVVGTMLKLAKESQRTVITTIHQPSSSIFNMFDRLLLLARGKTVYFGPAQEAVQYFAQQGFQCPIHTNPADYFLKLLSDKPYPAEGMLEGRVDQIIRFYEENCAQRVLQETDEALQEFCDDHKLRSEAQQDNVQRADFLQQLYLLCKREFLGYVRNQLLLKTRFGQTLFLGLLSGLIFLQLTTDGFRGFQDRSGAIFFVAVNQCFTTCFSVVQDFPLQKPLFLREYKNGMYGVTPFALSKLISDLPFQLVFPFIFASITYWMFDLRSEADHFILYATVLVVVGNAGVSLGYFVSSMAPSVDVALAVAPMVVIPFMLLGGLFINADSIPVYLVWLEKISPISHGFRTLAINEFRDNPSPSQEAMEEKWGGIAPLDRLSFDGDVATPMLALLGLYVGFRFLSYLIILYQARSF